MAESIVKEAEGPTRRIIQEERTKIADALMGGVAWMSTAVLAALGTFYLVDPKSKGVKFAGYGSAAALAGTGAILTAANLREPVAPPAAKPGTTSESVKSISDQAAASLVAAAEPRVRAIVEDERARVASSTQSGLPLAAGGALLALYTAVTSGPSPSENLKKASLYSIAALMATGGAWVALEGMRK